MMSDELESGQRKFWLDYIADVASGRVQNTLEALQADIELLRRELTNMKSQHETELDTFNAGLQTVIEKLQGGFDTLRARIEELKTQAQAPTAVTPPVEEIDDEIATMQSHLDQLNQLADSVGSAGAVATPPIISDTTSTGGPSGTPDVTPIAGESGPTNPDATTPGTASGDQHPADQPQPGTDSGTSGIPAGGVPGDGSSVPVADPDANPPAEEAPATSDAVPTTEDPVTTPPTVEVLPTDDTPVADPSTLEGTDVPTSDVVPATPTADPAPPTGTPTPEEWS